MVFKTLLNPQGSVEEVGSALEDEWRRVAKQEVEDTRGAIEMLEKEVVEEICNIMNSSNEALRLE